MWRWLDPLLLKAARRLEHLAVHHPSTYRQELTRTRGVLSPTATVTERAVIQSVVTPDRLHIGDHAYIDGEIFLIGPDARCTIGHHSFLATESRLWILDSITIGNYVQIAPRVDIFDNDSHSIDTADRRQDAINVFELKRPIDYSRVGHAPVIIEDDVWIGTKSTILKGISIGRGAVVAAGSVVTRDVPSFTLVGGNPAREIRKLPQPHLSA